MSGGADYEPVANSIQARAADRVDAPEPMAVAEIAPVEESEEVAEVTRARANLSDLAATAEAAETEERFEITLASVQPSNEQSLVPTVTAEPNSAAAAIEAAVEAAVNEEVIETEVFSLETYANASAQGFVTPAASDDIREVSGDIVNMRAGPGTEFEKLGALTKGTQIAVIDEPGNGWVMLEVLATGETGWMADWLVTASN